MHAYEKLWHHMMHQMTILFVIAEGFLRNPDETDERTLTSTGQSLTGS